MISILTGDALKMLRDLPDNCVHMCVTSPPYFGLRNYQVDGQIGLEPTPGAFVDAIVAVFREVRRVLRPDGTCWLNLGDGYSSGGNGPGSGKQLTNLGSHLPSKKAPSGFKPKDLLMIPARCAIALQADGWWLRSDIIWAKNNPMPESITDRPTSSHEHVFLLAKSDRYFFDAEAVKEPDTGRTSGNKARKLGEDRSRPGSHIGASVPWTGGNGRNVRNVWPLDEADRLEDTHEHVLLLAKSERYFYDADVIREPHQEDSLARAKRGRSGTHKWADGGPGNQTLAVDVSRACHPGGRNARNVWTINSASFKGAHFATFPPELARRCIAAGTSEVGACAHCGAPFKRVVEKGAPNLELQRRSGGDAEGQYTGQSTKDHDAAGVQNASDVKRRILAGMVERRTVDWIPTCKCPGAYPEPSLVLDPFFGAGTTGVVANQMGRNCLGIELNPDYVQMAAARLRGAGGSVVC